MGLHIERLVLDGLPLAPAEVSRLQRGLECELGRLLASAPTDAWCGGAIARLEAAPIRLAADREDWGRQFARTLAGTVCPVTPRERETTTDEDTL